LQADVPGYGTEWFNPDVVSKIFLWDDVQKKHEIAWNQDENCFIVHVKKGCHVCLQREWVVFLQA
jgi:hypothetical protein